MYFDAHTHLNSKELYVDRKRHLKEFQEHWWIGLINIGWSYEYNINWINISKALIENDQTPDVEKANKSWRYKKKGYYTEEETKTVLKNWFPKVYCTIWLHPYEVIEKKLAWRALQIAIKKMSYLYSPFKEFVVGIGECGIDTHQEGTESTLSTQKELFVEQCDLARQRELPIVIHSRANREATYTILKRFPDLTIYFHCRSYSPTEIDQIKTTFKKFYIWFCGNISYPKAVEIRKSLWFLTYDNTDYPAHIISWTIDSKSLPKIDTSTIIIDNVLIETDAPYLAPQSHRGETNSPAFIWETYKYISQLLGQDITKKVVENTKKCYKLP